MVAIHAGRNGARQASPPAVLAEERTTPDRATAPAEPNHRRCPPTAPVPSPVAPAGPGSVVSGARDRPLRQLPPVRWHRRCRHAGGCAATDRVVRASGRLTPGRSVQRRPQRPYWRHRGQRRRRQPSENRERPVECVRGDIPVAWPARPPAPRTAPVSVSAPSRRATATDCRHRTSHTAAPRDAAPVAPRPPEVPVGSAAAPPEPARGKSPRSRRSQTWRAASDSVRSDARNDSVFDRSQAGDRQRSYRGGRRRREWRANRRDHAGFRSAS